MATSGKRMLAKLLGTDVIILIVNIIIITIILIIGKYKNFCGES